MSRFAWLQFRTQAAVVFGSLVVVAIVLAVTGPHLVHLYDTTVATCATHSDCSTASTSFLKSDRTLQILLDGLVVVLPGLLGVFWGAPLVARELEVGTFRLAWTQSVGRTRWLAAKLAVVGLGSVVATGLLTLMVTWWSSPVDRANMSPFTSFDQRDIVPLGYAAFAFALGVLAGLVVRRTLPAMAATLAGFLASRLLFNQFVLFELISPKQGSFALNQETVQGFGQVNGGAFTLIAGSPNLSDAWILSTQFVDRAGQPLSPQVVASSCPLLGQGQGPSGSAGGGGFTSATQANVAARDALQNCVTKLSTSYHELVRYQPAGRYWSFQWYELAIYLAVAAILVGGSVLWIRRKAV